MPGLVPKKYMAVVFAFYMSAIMAFLMCGVLVALNTGLGGNYAWRVLQAYLVAWPIAFVCVIAVRPVVMKLVAATLKE